MTDSERTPEKDEPWQTRFLAAFRAEGLVTKACREAGVARSTVYDARQSDAHFAEAWREVEDDLTERLEREAYRRAAEGLSRDVFWKGQVVGQEQHYSDTLAIFLLKARRPEVYRETTRHEHTGADGGPILTVAELVKQQAEGIPE